MGWRDRDHYLERHGLIIEDTEPATPSEGPIQPLMSPYEDQPGVFVAPVAGRYRFTGNAFELLERADPEETADPVVLAATELLSSMETWEAVPEDHRAETPARFVSALRELTTPEPFKFTTFDAGDINEMITVSPIPFYTLCAHHVVPFFGHAWIGYVPDQKMAGLSKFARAVKFIAKGFWTQEHLTSELADFLEHELDPKGIAVVMKAEHMCMAMRGVQAPGVITTTSAMRGVFADHDRTAKAEFMAGVNGH